MEYLDPAPIRSGRHLLRDGACRSGVRRCGRPSAGRDPRRDGRRCRDRARLRDRRHLLRDPARALSGRDRRAHPDLAAAARPAGARPPPRTKRALVHGDVSPKNILVGPRGPVFLDAECAWYGDPAFDLAFCLNHLLLKCLWTPRRGAGFLACFDALAAAYLARRRLGAARPRSRRARRACCRGCCSRASTASRRSNTSPSETDKDRVRRVARRAAARAGRTARGDARGLGAAELGADERHARSPRVHGRRVWDSARPADRRGRGARWPAAPSAARSRRPAPRPARGEALDLRDGGDALRRPRRDAARSAHVNGEIAARADRAATPPTRPRSTRALIALDGTPEQVAARRQRHGRGVDGGAARRRRGARRCRCGAISAAAGAVTLPLPRDPDLRRRRACRRGASTSRTSWSSAPARRRFAEALDMDRRGLSRRRRADGASAGTLQGVADEGGWWPAFDTNEEALDDAGARDRARRLHARRARSRSRSTSPPPSSAAAAATGSALRRRASSTRDGMIELLLRLARPLSDRLDRGPARPRTTRDGLAAFTAAVGDRVQIIGDDFLVTNAARVREAARARRVQRGADQAEPGAARVTETQGGARRGARRPASATIVSARSGETEDVTIVHLAVGWDAGQLKVGSFARSERMAKWNEALRIEEALGRAPASPAPARCACGNNAALPATDCGPSCRQYALTHRRGLPGPSRELLSEVTTRKSREAVRHRQMLLRPDAFHRYRPRSEDVRPCSPARAPPMGASHDGLGGTNGYGFRP